MVALDPGAALAAASDGDPQTVTTGLASGSSVCHCSASRSWSTWPPQLGQQSAEGRAAPGRLWLAPSCDRGGRGPWPSVVPAGAARRSAHPWRRRPPDALLQLGDAHVAGGDRLSRLGHLGPKPSYQRRQIGVRRWALGSSATVASGRRRPRRAGPRNTDVAGDVIAEKVRVTRLTLESAAPTILDHFVERRRGLTGAGFRARPGWGLRWPPVGSSR